MGCPRCPFTSGVPSPCSPLLRQAWPAACPCAEHKMATSLVVGPTCAQTPSEPKSSAGCSETLTHHNQIQTKKWPQARQSPPVTHVGCRPMSCGHGWWDSLLTATQGNRVLKCVNTKRLSFVFLCLQILPQGSTNCFLLL